MNTSLTPRPQLDDIALELCALSKVYPLKRALRFWERVALSMLLIFLSPHQTMGMETLHLTGIVIFGQMVAQVK